MTISFRAFASKRIDPIAPRTGSSLQPRCRGLKMGAAMSLLLFAAPALSQTAPDLGSTSSFAIVSETFSNTTPGTVVDGNVCFTTGPAVSPTINGTETVPCPPQTGIDQNAARADLLAQSCTPIGAAVALDTISIGGGTPGVFPPGCYSSTGAMTITTGQTLTLSGSGVYIFRPGGSLDPAANSSVIAEDGACTDNVFWAPEDATTIGANADFVGTVFRGTAAGLSITLGDSATLEGRMLAFGSTVTTDNNRISVPDACPGTIIVEKQTDPPGSLQSFSFSGDATGSLSDGQQIVVDNLAPGNYSATESVPPGWELTSIVCDAADSTGDIAAATANFVLDADETVTCVFTNTQLPAPATLIVEKRTNPSGSLQSFSFSGDANGNLSDGQQIVVDNLATGDYSVTESVPAGWQLTDIVCSDADSSGDLAAATANFVLDAGETVTCVFINTEDGAAEGTITILKQADPPDTGQSFDFTGDLGNFSLMHGEFIVETRPPGTYAVSETVPAGWQLDSATCDDGSPANAIDLSAGESVTCTFSNSQLQPPGTIIVEKQTDPPGSLQMFSFSGDASGSLSDGGQIVVDNLAPGNYSATESVPPGWELTSIVCDDADSSGDLATATANFVLDADETVTCVFTNSQAAEPAIIPIFSRGGMALIALMMMLMGAAFLRYPMLSRG